MKNLKVPKNVEIRTVPLNLGINLRVEDPLEAQYIKEETVCMIQRAVNRAAYELDMACLLR